MTRQHCNSSMIACRIFIDWIYFFLIYFFKSTFSVGNFLIHFFHGLSFKTQKFCKHIELVFDTRNPKGLKCSECKRSTMAWICLNTMLDPCPTPRDHLRPKVLEGVVQCEAEFREPEKSSKWRAQGSSKATKMSLYLDSTCHPSVQKTLENSLLKSDNGELCQVRLQNWRYNTMIKTQMPNRTMAVGLHDATQWSHPGL